MFFDRLDEWSVVAATEVKGMCGKPSNTMPIVYCSEMPKDSAEQSIAEEGMHGQD
jgi:hypothetical protein